MAGDHQAGPKMTWVREHPEFRLLVVGETQECITSRGLREELSCEVRGHTMLQRQEGGWRGRKERRTSTVLWLTLRKTKEAAIGRGGRGNKSQRLVWRVGNEVFKEE